MDRLAKWWATLSLPFLLAQMPIAATAQQPNVSLSALNGSITSTDWLVHPNPLFVAPGQPGSSVITIDPRYRDINNIERQYTGRLSLDAICCGIPGGSGLFSLVGPGIDVSVGQLAPTHLDLGGGTPAWLRERLGGNRLTLSSSSSFVDITGQPTTVNLNASAGPVSGLVPGRFLVFFRAADPGQGVNKVLDLMISVLPPWPPDGPAPACTPGLEVLPLSSLPGPNTAFSNVYSLKASNPAKTSYTFAANSLSAHIGFEFTIRDEGSTPPLSPDQAVIRFTNTEGQPVGIRSSDSRNCAVPGQQWWAHVGDPPTTFTISTADTTTLVFSRTVCRHFFIFCWGRHGSEDVLQFSEGAFWTLFGGRAVDIATVGNWDDAMGPFVGEIRTP